MARKMTPAGKFPGDRTFRIGETTEHSKPFKRTESTTKRGKKMQRKFAKAKTDTGRKTSTPKTTSPAEPRFVDRIALGQPNTKSAGKTAKIKTPKGAVPRAGFRTNKSNVKVPKKKPAWMNVQIRGR